MKICQRDYIKGEAMLLPLFFCQVLMEETKDELVIDPETFSQHFFDVKRHRPQKGQIMAKFTAVAVFGYGPEKFHIIDILRKDKAEAAAQVMKKIHCAREPDCYRVCREMCEDMLSGMSDEEVAKKEYEFVIEMFYYTKRECVPKDNPHWETIDLVKYDPETKTFKCDI